jgi:hypothetical protein
MKKEIIYYLVLLILISGLIFIETKNDDQDEVNISKVIDVKDFQKLDIDVNCNVYVSIGEEQRVVLEGPEQYLNKIETSFENGILKLSEKTPGILGGFLKSGESTESINLYLKLTSTDQLVTPMKGNLITNESTLNNLQELNYELSFNKQLEGLLRLIGNQTGFIIRFAQ